ncbi:hypothetical protein M427DRAFT_142532 [Gonapodya prolifera JEL478]|uniref:HD domain-containing protein n=1 Tax=Gonapodya prolifera (strain JEL478) TaxID=1344416 RepID=A0A139AVL2_GONPJ|nr:hypothetical protein M427DRAFT_142532 [Gonapodya prolifera JEL478]|eukprot:KXS20757.1 hypothetical protein M427DRAFT_142532 [Gonapodya prolifera JEL478]
MEAKRANFKSMDRSTQEDWNIIMPQAMDFGRNLSNRVIKHLKLLDGDFGGFPVDRLTHCVQTASRAHRDGKDDEYVVAALLHDIGDTLGSSNHADIAAAILKPFVSEKLHWIIEHHAEFQGRYFFNYIGLDQNMHEKYRDHPWYKEAWEFVNKYDCPAFDPEYESEPLEFFIPMVERVFAHPKRSIYKREQPDAASVEASKI